MPYNGCLPFHYWLNFNSNEVHSAYNPYIHLIFFKCVFLHSALAREGNTVEALPFWNQKLNMLVDICVFSFALKIFLHLNKRVDLIEKKKVQNLLKSSGRYSVTSCTDYFSVYLKHSSRSVTGLPFRRNFRQKIRILYHFSGGRMSGRKKDHFLTPTEEDPTVILFLCLLLITLALPAAESHGASCSY